MTNTKMLQEMMRSRGYTIDKLSIELGLSRTGLFNKIHNKSEFKLSEIESISSVLKLSKEKKACIFFAKRVELNSTQ